MQPEHEPQDRINQIHQDTPLWEEASHSVPPQDFRYQDIHYQECQEEEVPQEDSLAEEAVASPGGPGGPGGHQPQGAPQAGGHQASDRLVGNPPFVYNGNPTHAEEFLAAWKLYQ